MVDIYELGSHLIPKVESMVPAVGDFRAVYTEYKVGDRNLCLTDILLKVEPLPELLHCTDNLRYLTIVDYKHPALVKCSQILCRGTKEEILHLLRTESLILG